ncbi:Hypothetical predicted protein [Octopus vulgaris]|uniref:Uncharacterized protein n=1 Tax=Octopus vulgaris TaxID=6645 RepID=A0AA36ALZ3_OCTVU|nr:Hypothetical predicted protein [Octopus vulgaris]
MTVDLTSVKHHKTPGLLLRHSADWSTKPKRNRQYYAQVDVSSLCCCSSNGKSLTFYLDVCDNWTKGPN